MDSRLFFFGCALCAQVTRNHVVALQNWQAPLYWQPSSVDADPAIRPPAAEAATPVGSLVFVAMTPCRVVDTRAGMGFPGAFGPPSLAGGLSVRTIPRQSSNTCSILSIAQAYSFNVTVVPQGTLGFLTLYPATADPQPPPPPNVSTLNSLQGCVVANASIVPAGTDGHGGVDVYASNPPELIIDINGYYAPSTGVTLAHRTASAPSLSFAGDAGTGIFSSGAGTLSLATGGTAALTVRSDADLDMHGNIRKGGALFLHLPSYHRSVACRVIWRALFALMTLSAAEQSPLERAVTLAREKRYAEAHKLLEGVAEPADIGRRVPFHRLKAAVASGLGDAKTAAAEMRRALDLAPADPALLLATSLAELQAGLLEDALRHAQSAENTAQAQALIGEIQEKRGEFVDSAAAYQAAVTLAPDREAYRIALALELVQHQSFTPAIAVLKQAAPLFPKSGRIRTLLGIAQFGEGDVANATTSLTEAITVDSKLEPAYAYLTRIVLESSAAPPEGILQPLCGWNSTVCSALKLRIARERDDAKLESEAIAGLKRAPATDSIACCELGRAYEWRGQLADARGQMEDCVRLAPSPQNHYRLGLIYGRLGLTQLAGREMALRQKAMDNQSEDAARRAEALQTFQYILK